MKPRYRQIAADLERRLKAHEWPVGTPLPGLSELQKYYRASLNVVRGAQALLIEAGLLRSVQGKGVYVLQLPPDDLVDTRTLAKQRLADAEAALLDARRALESDDDLLVCDGNQEISGPAHIRFVVRGQLIVQSGGRLQLGGSVERGLIVEDGGRAEIGTSGRVNNLLVEPGGQVTLKGLALGVVENCRGGRLTVEGEIFGELLGQDHDGTVILPGASVKPLQELPVQLCRTSRGQ